MFFGFASANVNERQLIYKMTKFKTSDFLPEEKRQEYLKKIASFFLDERGEEIGVIAAGKVLDFFIEEMGKEFYKKGALDAKKLLKEKLEDWEVEVDLL